jgi:hypothetical protein
MVGICQSFVTISVNTVADTESVRSEVDYAGDPIEWLEVKTGEIHEVWVFVAALGFYHLRRLEDPETTLGELRRWSLTKCRDDRNSFPILRVLIDGPRSPARFLLPGSASPALLRQSSESLTGPIEVIETAGLSVEEVGQNIARLWLRGGLPKSFVAVLEPSICRNPNASRSNVLAFRASFERERQDRSQPPTDPACAARPEWHLAGSWRRSPCRI